MNPLRDDPGASISADGLKGLLDSIDLYLGRGGKRLPWIDRLCTERLLTAEGLVLAFLGLLLLLLMPPLIDLALRRLGRTEENFRGDRIPQSFGLVTLVWGASMLALSAWMLPRLQPEYSLWLVACIGFGLLGFVDDTWGNKRIKGLRGHFRAALKERTLTTGFIKAMGGALLALWLGVRVEAGGGALRGLLAAGLIALGANAVNLLDLRPGRAGSVFLISALPLIVLGLQSGSAGAPPLLLITLPALIVWERDARGRVMMGDTGSNLLGACLGLAIAQTCPLVAQATILGLLIGLHLLAERISLTRAIAGNRLLRALDRLTGVR